MKTSEKIAREEKLNQAPGLVRPTRPDNRAEYQTYTRDRLIELLHLDDQRIAALEAIILAMPPCPQHGPLCLSHALEWVRAQQAPKRPKA